MSKQKNIAFRVLALLLVAVMCFGLTACSKSSGEESEWSTWTEVSYETTGSDSDDTDDTNQGTDKTSSTASKKPTGNSGTSSKTQKPSGTSSNLDTTVDKSELKGYKFTIMSPYLPKKLTSSCTGFEKLLFQRIKEVEVKFGCKIELIVGTETGVENLQPLISASKKVADVVEVIADNVLPLARANYIIPWDDVEGININDEKWVSGYTGLATFDNKHYGLQFMKPPEARAVVMFNKNLLKEKGINADELYELAKNKQWTFAKLEEYATKFIPEANNPVYGVGGPPGRAIMALTLANDGRLVTYKNGRASATFQEPAVVEAVKFYDKLVNTYKCVDIPEELKAQKTYGSLSFTYYDELFLKGKLAFLLNESYIVNQQLRTKAKFDYGILPVPIGPNNKTGNYISSAGNARIFAMTSTNAKSKDFAKSVTIFNELSKPSKGYEGNEWWEYDVKSEYFQKGSADKDFEMYMTSINTSDVDPGWRLLTLKDSFMEKGVLGPIFWGGMTVDAGINSIVGIFDKTIDSVFNK